MEKLDQNKKKKISQAINLLEELAWILDSKKNIDLKEIPTLLRGLIEKDKNIIIQKYASPNSNKNYLVGILPNLFQDEELFKTNSELLEFAENVLNLKISKEAKRSRVEYIGLIVCEVTKLNDSNLTNLVEALGEITGSTEKLRLIKEAKKQPNFTWNDAIQKLSTI